MQDSTAQRLLFALKSRGELTAAQAGEQLGITAVGARQHLLKLQSQGLVGCEDRRQPVGRPQRHWRLTASGHNQFPDSHSQLTVELLRSVDAVFGADGLDRLIQHRESAALELYGEALGGRDGIETKLSKLAELRTREGYMAEWRREAAGEYMFVENHCPICAAASACQGLCRSELEIFRRVLGAGVSVERTDHLLAGARRCAYRVVENT